MNGQKNAYKKSIVDEFIKTNNPYAENKSLQFDIRAYASYVKENHLDATQISDSVLKRFSKE